MAALMFDTHTFVKELTEAGMPERQAELLARSQTALIDEKLATKEDLKKLEQTTKRDLKDLELRMTLRLGSMMVVSIGVIAVLVELL